MNTLKVTLIALIGTSVMFASCKTWNNTQKGAAVGTAGGAAVGTAVGSAFGKAGLGAIIGAAVGGTAGTIIGHKMDKQAADIKTTVPDAKVERVDEGIVVEFSSNVLFAINKFELTADSKMTLDKLVTVLNGYPDTDVQIQGHTDNTGKEDYNQTLSEKRASSVGTYLVQKGIAKSRITTVGYGMKVPKYPNDTEANRAQNRRVEFLISANEKMKADAEKEAQQNK